MSEISSNVHFTGGDKVSIAGSPADVADQLATTKASTGGFNLIKGSNGTDVFINRELVTHITQGADYRAASFS